MSKLQSIIERACRTWFPGETIWINHRPDWLYGMEIDIFLPDLQIAIEVQGHQHHLFVPDLQETVDAFKAQRDRDKRKKHLIRQRGIAFFEVPCVNLVMGGLQQKLSNHICRRLSTPADLKREWSKHRHYLNTCRDMVRYKLKRGALIPINKKSAKALKAAKRQGKNFLSASNNDVVIAAPPVAHRPIERVRLASATPQQAGQPAASYTDRPHPAMAYAHRSESASAGTAEHPANFSINH